MSSLAQEIEMGYSALLIRVLGIPVTISATKGGTLVTDDVVNMHGVGDSLQAAIDDYKSMVTEYLEILEAGETRLSEHLKEHLRYLRAKPIR